MNRTTSLVFLGVGLMVSPLLGRFADSAVPASPKIAVIDFERALGETPTGKKANAEFEATVKAKQADIDKRQTELKKLASDLEKQRTILKPDALAAREADLQKKAGDLQQYAAGQEKDLATARQNLVGGVLKKAQPLIIDLAKAEGVQIILDRNAVVWSDPAFDLTAKLEAKM